VHRYVTVKITSVVKDSSTLAVNQSTVQSVAMKPLRPKTLACPVSAGTCYCGKCEWHSASDGLSICHLTFQSIRKLTSRNPVYLFQRNELNHALLAMESLPYLRPPVTSTSGSPFSPLISLQCLQTDVIPFRVHQFSVSPDGVFPVIVWLTSILCPEASVMPV